MKILKEFEAKEMFDEYLDEIYGEVNIAGYEYSTAEALKEIDPIAYEESFKDFVDNLAAEQKIYVEGYTDEEIEEQNLDSEMGM